MDIVTHIAKATTRRERIISDDAYQRGRNDAAREWKTMYEDAQRLHERELAAAKQEGRREGYTSRVKDQIATECKLLPFPDAVTRIDEEIVKAEFPDGHFLDLTCEEAQDLAYELEREATSEYDPVDHDADRKALIEEDM